MKVRIAKGNNSKFVKALGTEKAALVRDMVSNYPFIKSVTVIVAVIGTELFRSNDTFSLQFDKDGNELPLQHCTLAQGVHGKMFNMNAGDIVVSISFEKKGSCNVYITHIPAQLDIPTVKVLHNDGCIKITSYLYSNGYELLLTQETNQPNRLSIVKGNDYLPLDDKGSITIATSNVAKWQRYAAKF